MTLTQTEQATRPAFFEVIEDPDTAYQEYRNDGGVLDRVFFDQTLVFQKYIFSPGTTQSHRAATGQAERMARHANIELDAQTLSEYVNLRTLPTEATQDLPKPTPNSLTDQELFDQILRIRQPDMAVQFRQAYPSFDDE